VVEATENTFVETPGALSVREVRLRWAGPTMLAEADVVVAPALTVTQAHEIAHMPERHQVSGGRRLGSATIHISPAAPRRLAWNRNVSGDRPQHGQYGQDAAVVIW
jgi:divalent metal cation (Fe/Co/Zn/Cd) transporter